MGPTVFHPYPRRLESLTINFADVITKAALSSQLFKDPECWSGWGLNPRPSAQQTGSLPAELTRQREDEHFMLVSLWCRWTSKRAGGWLYDQVTTKISWMAR